MAELPPPPEGYTVVDLPPPPEGYTLINPPSEQSVSNSAPGAPKPRAVIDTPLAGAGFWTNLRAGLAPGENDQISRFAAARFPNLPITEAVKRYGVVNGHIVYADPQGNYARETPSVSGATGPLDAFTRAGDFAAKEAGPTIPGAAGAAAGALVGPTGASIPAAAGTAAAVDVGRQALDKWLAGEPLHIDYLNSAGQGALAGVGQAAGVGAIKALNSNPLAVSAYDRTAAMDPATQAAAAALESEAARRGVNLSAGQSTGLRSVQATERQLSRYPETADQIYDFQKTQRQEQIPAAMRDEIAKISPAPPGEAAIGQFREGADKVVSDALNARAAQAKEAYTRALDGAPDADGNIVPKGPFWNEAVGSLMERPSMVRAIGRAQELAAEKGYSIKVPTYENGKLVKSEIAPDWRSWDYIKQGLDGEIEANTNDLGRLNTYGKAVADTKRELLSVLDKANPDYLAARLQYGSASDTVKTMLDGGLGILNTLKDAQPMDRVAIVRRMFDAGNLTPEEVGRMRVNFGVAGKQGEWNAGFANWLSDKLDTALTQAGDAGNVSAKLYKGIWQDPRQANIVRAALGPDGRAEGIEKLMEVVQASAKGLPEGSPTATDSAAMSSDAGKMISKGARVAATVVSPGSWLHLPELAMEGLAALRAPEKRIALAQTLLSGDAAGKLKQLAMLSPTSEKAVTLAGQILEMGGVGLSSLRTPRDFAPPAAP